MSPLSYSSPLCSFVSDPTPAERACQGKKSILLNVGGMNFPAPWAPNILPFQIFRLGNLFILGIPGTKKKKKNSPQALLKLGTCR